jgi:hypothetical protein
MLETGFWMAIGIWAAIAVVLNVTGFVLHKRESGN